MSKGWGGLGDESPTPDDVFMLENTPHDWLFPRVSAVIHHGGAGTTAIGLKCGKPTMIVPFFGDQPFWGSMVGKAGAGADPIPYKHLSSDALAEGIRQCLAPHAQEAAEGIARAIAEEGDGAKNAVDSFHRHLPIQEPHSLRCSVLPDRVAVWMLKESNLRLSALAATMLVQEKKIRWSDLKLLRHCEWNDFEGPGEPVTGAGAAILTTVGGAAKGVGSVPVKWARIIRRRDQRRKSRAAAPLKHSIDLGVASRQETTTDKPQDHQLKKRISSTGALSPKTNSLISKPPHKEHTNTNLEAPSPAEDSGVGTSVAATPASEENVFRDLAKETGTGIAKTGEAIAKGVSPSQFKHPLPSR